MENKELNILIGSLKAQVNVLEAKIKQVQKSAKGKKFADFYGILSGFGETSEEEINAVKFTLKESLL
jgi:hypothetical protein